MGAPFSGHCLNAYHKVPILATSFDHSAYRWQTFPSLTLATIGAVATFPITLTNNMPESRPITYGRGGAGNVTSKPLSPALGPQTTPTLPGQLCSDSVRFIRPCKPSGVERG